MSIKQEHMVGFAVGIGAAAAGYYLYRKNQAQVDQFLKEHGIEMPSPATVDAESLTLEQSVAEKERLEDLIAEREMDHPPRAKPGTGQACPPAQASKTQEDELICCGWARAPCLS